MPRRKSKTLTELELEIMRVVWERGEVTAEEISAELDASGRPLSPQSVRTMLGILKDKRYMGRRRRGRGYVYSARVTEEEARTSFLSDVMDRVFDGSPLSLLASLLSSGMVSRRDIDRVKRLIRDHERSDQS